MTACSPAARRSYAELEAENAQLRAIVGANGESALWNAGFDARSKGQPETDNPFPFPGVGTPESEATTLIRHLSWASGWVFRDLQLRIWEIDGMPGSCDGAQAQP